MKTVNVHEAKTTLSQLLSQVENGEEIVIARNGVPVARLVAFEPGIRREPGVLAKFQGWSDFVYNAALFAPMTDAEIEDQGWPL